MDAWLSVAAKTLKPTVSPLPVLAEDGLGARKPSHASSGFGSLLDVVRSRVSGRQLSYTWASGHLTLYNHPLLSAGRFEALYKVLGSDPHQLLSKVGVG